MPETIQSDLPPVFVMFNEIGIINQLAGDRFAKALPDGLTPAQFSVLNNFVRLGGYRTPSQLAAAFQVTKGAMTNTLNRLQQKKLINMTANPADGRGKIVRITQRGRQMRDMAIKLANPQFDDMSEMIEQHELQSLLPILQRIRKHLDENRPEG